MNTSAPAVLAISGSKNSGKTTLIEALIPIISAKGLKVAVIKHHGHKFGDEIPDKEGRDTYKFLKQGAYATTVFDDDLYMLVKRKPVDERELIEHFSDADLILLEGFKFSDWPKIELVRDVAKFESNTDTLIGVVTNCDVKSILNKDVPIFSYDAYDSISDLIFQYMEMQGE